MIDGNILEIERQLLGCYLLGADIGPGITDAVFSTQANRIIFSVLSGLKKKNLSLDMVLLVTEIEKQDKLEAVGGAAGLASIDCAVSQVNTRHYEGLIIDAYNKRYLFQAVSMAREALAAGKDTEAVSLALLSSLTSTTHDKSPDKILFSELLSKQFPPDNWIIENLISEGLTILAGASKTGKSWAALQLVSSIDSGGYFLGTLKAAKSDCLYFALEDSQKRIQKRLKKQNITGFNNSLLMTKRMTPAELRSFLIDNPSIKVVVIDTLQKYLNIEDTNSYSETVTGISLLKSIADDLDRSIVVIHHVRKNNTFDGDHLSAHMGSTGIVATADAILTLRRKRGESQAVLMATGRDIEDQAISLKWDKDICSWSVTDNKPIKPALSEAQQEIIDILESEARSWTTGELIKITGKTTGAMGNLLARLESMELIENPSHGQWRLKNKLTHSLFPIESEKVSFETPPEDKDLDLF